jgi:hypothetical protein
MIYDQDSFRRAIINFFGSLRISIDRPYRDWHPSREIERDRYTKTMLLIEEARIRFNSIVRFKSDLNTNDLRFVCQELLAFIDSFMSSKIVDPNLLARKFRIAPPYPSSERNKSPIFLEMEEWNGLVIGDALQAFRHLIIRAIDGGIPSQGTLDFQNAPSIIPRQQLAPAQFEIRNGKISVKRSQPAPRKEDISNVSLALNHIINSGQNLIDTLKNSNCDNRLVEQVSLLNKSLSANDNIIQIGLTNIACNIMSSQFKEELPDAVVSMFYSYNNSISMYAAQFPEWEKFVSNANNVELSPNDISDIEITADNIANELSQETDISDENVPQAIKKIRSFIQSPGTGAKKAAFALLKTIENLVSSIIHHTSNLIEKTTSKTIEGLSAVASKLIIGLLGIALLGATGIAPAALRAGAPWVQQAAELLKKQIDKSID